MPGNLRPIIFLRKKIQELLAPGWVKPKPVYLACGLLIIAGTLLSSVVISLQQTAVEQPAGYADGLEQPGAESLASPIADPAAAGTDSIRPPVESTAQADRRQQPVPAAAKPRKPQWPVKGEISREFGWQLHPVFHDWRYHPGLDISAADGTFVQAMLGGRIADIYTDNKTGLTIVIASGEYTISYGSLDTMNVSLKKGSYVNQGDQLGTVGACAAEPYTHLHLTVKADEQYIDPRNLLK
ncbi:M23 family metallopeptidase|uniref:Peptidase family M23 n=1 Tax=Dendrosporobacter quercicolus TaxID=146817 RepID=A0A1G9R3I5_9FIRM|nr:M23 family metallopeptidase [Dendrosporobacter quercicolus]NSL48453.1 M23 family metallopeptidase [Dendrosporobacter quercicolus DSM 1736]SDM17417.1 Peptidase family M23 [Dendrosporobacter quercicolus]